AAGGQPGQPGRIELLEYELKCLLESRLDNLAHLQPGHGPAIAGVEGRDVDGAIVFEQLGQSVPVTDLDLFGGRKRSSQADRQVVADLETTYGQHAGEHQGAFDKDADV